jgi:hypothetical protein
MNKVITRHHQGSVSSKKREKHHWCNATVENYEQLETEELNM